MWANKADCIDIRRELFQTNMWAPGLSLVFFRNQPSTVHTKRVNLAFYHRTTEPPCAQHVSRWLLGLVKRIQRTNSPHAKCHSSLNKAPFRTQTALPSSSYATKQVHMALSYLVDEISRLSHYSSCLCVSEMQTQRINSMTVQRLRPPLLNCLSHTKHPAIVFKYHQTSPHGSLLLSKWDSPPRSLLYLPLCVRNANPTDKFFGCPKGTPPSAQLLVAHKPPYHRLHMPSNKSTWLSFTK
jgi:hypothetical protein